MRRLAFALAALLLPSALLLPLAVARADCQSGIAAAMRRAKALPPTAGRAALLEQIQRADVARHEDDNGECVDQLAEATAVLDEIDAAKKRAAPAPAAPPKAAAKGAGEGAAKPK